MALQSVTAATADSVFGNGSTNGVATDVIHESTSAAGVTIDGVLLKDGGVTLTASGAVSTDTISEKTAATGVTIDGVLLKDGGVTLAASTALVTDVISEKTAATGVTIDGCLIKDGAVQALKNIGTVTADGAITIGTASKTFFITKAGVAAMTIADPTATTHDGLEYVFIATTANAHTLNNSAGSGFFSSGGATKDVATFSGAIGDGIAIVAYQGKWYIDPRGTTGITLG